jgi:hypothetical protein
MNAKNSLWWILTLALLAMPAQALGQYKNASFGFDAAGWILTLPSAVDDAGNILPLDNRPMRLSQGLRFGGETNWKLNHDQWWFTGRVNVAFMTFPSGDASSDDLQQQYDAAASSSIGTVFGVEAGIGIRYFFLTDRIRPYIQVGTSYMRLFTLSTVAEGLCTDNEVCESGEYTNSENFFPHPNVGALHVQPGLEWVFARDMALHIYADTQYWIIFNAPDNISLAVGLGVNFYL